MSDIRLHLLSKADAELALVDLWLRVARYNLTEPELSMRMYQNDKVDLTLATKDEVTMVEWSAWSRVHGKIIPTGTGRSSERALAASPRPAPREWQKEFSAFRRTCPPRERLECQRGRRVVHSRKSHLI
jgi:hypothetical protein